MDGGANDPRPSKRVKVDSSETNGTVENASTMAPQGDHSGPQLNAQPSLVLDDTTKEREVGIVAFVDESRDIFRGVLKKRYTDFLVNEILPNGTVVHLRSIKAISQTARSEAERTDPIGEGILPQEEQETKVAVRASGEGETTGEEVSTAKENASEDAKGQDMDDQRAEVDLPALPAVPY